MITITVNNFRIYTEERSFTFEYGKLFQLAGGSGEGKEYPSDGFRNGVYMELLKQLNLRVIKLDP